MYMDWEKESQQVFTLVPDGEYLVKVKKWEYAKSKAKGTDQIQWTYEVSHGPQKGQTILDYQVLLEQSLWRVGWMVASCNVDLKGLKKMSIKTPVFDAVLDACVGRKMSISVMVDEYNGKKNNKVTNYAVIEKDAVKPSVAADKDIPKELLVDDDELKPDEETPF